ncbi:MAG: hypothetical protein UW11_C0036G0002 [Parcubacteria group bacterium GW2011_GWA2_43_9b]|uniref:Uncharacterized protein n=1 Tax=Candidatus Portnoybacteria bacterium RIFCSPLOWO2_02_FULL_39_11 TaxID=1802001 RepID=A0A1G2FST2_9BACT|nr:MAG: hypothetical protein UW11_C0036G0002 [Parcubacteria group bacterium GW2011_GWA2_43_9b]OGZ40601.1 MAG: hypothetical protein A3B04_02535 [Candidatus Portnoybacteria bacterium RIFCSPLOWO2_02_FULL_39_11]
MFIADLTPKQKIYSGAGIFLVILALIIILIIMPLISQIKNDGLELAQKKQTLEDFYKNYQALEAAQKNYQTAQDEIYALPAFLSPNDALKFIVLMEKFAQTTGNTQNVSVDASSRTATSTLDFQVNLNGDFPGLIKFLTYLESAPYYNDIKSIQAQRLSEKNKDNTGASGNINTVLKISVYQ